MKNLFIVIVSFNAGETLIRLIDSLVRGNEVKIVVVENGNKEFRIKNYESRLKIIRNNKNLGFAAGSNIGIRYALENGADAVLLLNQDVVIERGVIKSLIDNPADIVSPVIKFRRNKTWVYDFGGRIDWSIGRTWHMESVHLGGAMASLRSACHHPRWSNLEYVSGCCILVKKEVFKRIGLFDEKFFLYFEDVDFCLRAQKAGFKIAVEPKSMIIHNLIEGKNKSFSQKWHLVRSNFIFINKYLGARRILGYIYLLILAIKIML